MTMCDEPIDLSAIRADDALIDAIARGDAEAMRALSGVELAELVEILAALAGTAVVTHLRSARRSHLTECCQRPIAGLSSKIDHVTDEPEMATCPGMQS